MKKKYEMLKVRDPSDKNHIKVPILADLPFKLAIVGRSQVSLGKTSIILNLFLRKKYYRNYFKGENIYIISNNNVDTKLKILMEELEIPESNFMAFDEDVLEALYDNLEEEQEVIKVHNGINQMFINGTADYITFLFSGRVSGNTTFDVGHSSEPTVTKKEVTVNRVGRIKSEDP